MLNPARALARGRTAAEALMVDTCTIQHKTGEATDLDVGTTTPAYATVYAGKCKVQVSSQHAGSATSRDVGQAGRLIGELEVHVPVSATGLQPDDLVTVTASALDPDLVGRTFRLRGMAHKSFLTARRFPMIEVMS